MATSGGFTPPAVPECPYAPRMTRAQALALRAAGGLKENCVVVITDGPTIGNGTTSPTEIELNPTGPSELGLTARVHTTFDNEAWVGLYDIDLGTAGSIIELHDNRGNDVYDENADSPTVHTQFPWGNANFIGNTVSNSTLTGFATQVGAISYNEIRNSTLNWSGKTSVANVAVTQTTFLGVTQTVSGSFNASRSRIVDTTITSSAGLGGHTFNDSEIIGWTLNVPASNGVTITRSKIAGGTANFAGVGNAQTAITDSILQACTLTRAALGLGGITITAGSVLNNCTINVAANTPNVSTFITITASALQTCIINQNAVVVGPTITLTNVIGTNSTVQNTAAATRALTVSNSTVTGTTVNQQRTVGNPADTVTLSSLLGGTLTFLAGAGGSFSATVSGLTMSGASIVQVQDPAANGTVILNTNVENQSTLVVSSGGIIQRSRISGNANITLGAFTHNQLIVDGPFTKTLTAANVFRLANKAFDDTI